MRLLRILAAAAAFATAPAILAAPPWPEAPYSYQSSNQRLADVLAEFARQFGLRAHVSPDVEGILNGRIAASSPTDFLNRLGNMYGLTWFHYSGTVYVTRSGNVATRSLSLPSTAPGTMRQALTDLGLFDARFGWAELPERGAVLVSGPPDYIELVVKVLAALPQVPADQNVQVFRLKHAAVDDRVIFFRDKQITTPGVATILRNLIAGNLQQSGTQTTLLELAAPLRAAAPLAGAVPDAGSVAPPGPSTVAAAQGATGPGAAARPSPPPATANAGLLRRPVIQSDPRLNAIIVRDTQDRMPVYEKLIAFLDQPSALIEIEALIMDVNTTKLEELGIDWMRRNSVTTVGFGRPEVERDRTSMVVTRGQSVNPTSMVVQGAGNFLLSRVKVLEGTGDARVLSRPSVLTADNLGALIDLSETFYVRVTGERVAQLVPITAGTTLRVTPRFVEHDGRRLIQLVVDIEDGNIQDRNVETLPTVRRSAVSTQATIGESQSLLIGGYNTEVDITQNDKVPVLGDIPLLGGLFRNSRKDVQRRERLFLITPKIVAMPHEGAPVASSILPAVIPAKP